ncbi:MAG: hypothetical protein SFY66_13575 [Oculatellaceae cyanobacterium bins.114]|nr:hypothetical protein [Oculatellaceae cyanobacterium bins.114]
MPVEIQPESVQEQGDRPSTAPTLEPDLPLPKQLLTVSVLLSCLNRVVPPTTHARAVPPVHTFAIRLELGIAQPAVPVAVCPAADECPAALPIEPPAAIAHLLVYTECFAQNKDGRSQSNKAQNRAELNW